MSVRPDPSWMADAACRGVNVDIFFPGRETPGGVGPDAYDEARAICARCKVADACLDYALTSPVPRYGMWAGRTQKELFELRQHRTRRHVCHQCSTVFPAPHSGQRYCSDTCRDEARVDAQRRYQARYRVERRGA